MQNQRRRARPGNQTESTGTTDAKVERGKRVLLAGASSVRGAAIADELTRRGYYVRGLTRRASNVTASINEIYVGDLIDATTLVPAYDSMDMIISVAGSPQRFIGVRGGRHTFAHIDDVGNRTLLAGAAKAKVNRFAYVANFGGRFMGMSEVLRAQESFIAALRSTSMRTLVVRAAPVFANFEPLLRRARKKRVRVLGTGWAELNPIHQADLATAVVDALEANEKEIDVGGPEVWTRREIAELAVAAWGRDAKVRGVPWLLANYWSQFARFRGRHNKAMSSFETTVAFTDIVAPEYGERELEAYFADCVSRWSAED
jgi:uncharacterized protein YbjT (DUF2867 family)